MWIPETMQLQICFCIILHSSLCISVYALLNLSMSLLSIFLFFCLYVSVAIGPASGSRAMYVTRFVVSFPWWVRVILLFIASVVAFQLSEPQRGGRTHVNCTVFIHLFPITQINIYTETLVNTPCWRYTYKTSVIWEQPSRSGALVALTTSHWRSSSRRREQNPLLGTPMYSGSACSDMCT